MKQSSLGAGRHPRTALGKQHLPFPSCSRSHCAVLRHEEAKPLKCFSTPAETGSVGGLVNRTVPRDNRSLLLQECGLVIKLQLPAV